MYWNLMIINQFTENPYVDKYYINYYGRVKEIIKWNFRGGGGSRGHFPLNIF